MFSELDSPLRTHSGSINFNMTLLLLKETASTAVNSASFFKISTSRWNSGVQGQRHHSGSLVDDLLTNQSSLNGHNVIRVRWPKLLFGQYCPELYYKQLFTMFARQVFRSAQPLKQVNFLDFASFNRLQNNLSTAIGLLSVGRHC